MKSQVIWEKEVCGLTFNLQNQTKQKTDHCDVGKGLQEDFESNYYDCAGGRNTLPELKDKISS